MPNRSARSVKKAPNRRKKSPGTAPRRSRGRGSKKSRAATAQEMSARQREISVAEFFQKNRHLLGFDSPRKALLTTVKEAVDNSLDACEEAGILPEVEVRIEAAPENGKRPPTPAQANRFVVSVTDNGPGIIRKNVGKVFAKLLYGSKFHRLRQSRGQQGIGISAAGMYGQLTTGKPLRVTTKLKNEALAHELELSIDTKKNLPVEHETSRIEWDRPHGTRVVIELEGRYQRGRTSVGEYLEQTSVANPHVRLVYCSPEGKKTEYPRGVNELPRPPREIKPHPLGIELGLLVKMGQDTKSRTLSGFLAEDFSRVSPRLAVEVCQQAGLSPRMRPRELAGGKAEALFRSIQQTKFRNPPTGCISPIGEKAILAGLYKQIRGDFYTAVTRPPAVYRGNPFAIEVGLAFGSGSGAWANPGEDGEQPAGEPEPNGNGHGGRKLTLAELKKAAKRSAKEAKRDSQRGPELARVIRFANRVPLLYQQSACATFKAVLETSWKKYGLAQSRGALPQGPLAIFVHMASVWVPFTSESKEAIADYDEIRKEIRLALQECGRRLSLFVRRREKARYELNRRGKFSLYIPEVAQACARLKQNKGALSVEKLKRQLQAVADQLTGGEKPTEALKRKENAPPAELPHTILVTAEGVQGEVPVPLPGEDGEPGEPVESGEKFARTSEPAVTPELISGATEKPPRLKKASKSKKRKKKSARKPRGRKGKSEQKRLF